MNSFIRLFLLSVTCCFLHASGATAKDGGLDSEPSLKLIVQVMSWPVEGGVKILAGAYLVNESNKAVSLVLGPANEKRMRYEDGPGVAYDLEPDLQGNLLKPVPSDVRMITLEARQRCELRKWMYVADEDYSFPTHIIPIYTVSESVGEMYDVWTGRIYGDIVFVD